MLETKQIQIFPRICIEGKDTIMPCPKREDRG